MNLAVQTDDLNVTLSGTGQANTKVDLTVRQDSHTGAIIHTDSTTTNGQGGAEYKWLAPAAGTYSFRVVCGPDTDQTLVTVP